ncbi:TolB family protein [Nonomuraea sp. NPDC004354]
MRKALILAAALLVLGGGALFYTVRAARVAAEGGPAAFDLARPGQIVVRDGRTGLVRGSRTRCERFATASGTGICLVTDVAKTYAVVVDRTMRETRRLHIAGIPSRARVSSSGRMISWTVFVTGDSYNTSGFSTWTGILDNRTGYAVTNMEQIPLIKDGRRYHSADVNYWGVTFAPDDNRFYATVSTRGKTYLVQGDYGKWEARVLRANAECPSLSPDGGRLVFKKRMPGGTWRLHALDLATMAETPLAEQADVDDQAAWLDGDTVMYAKGGDVWAVPADGTGAPRLLVADASSPSAVR